jgi:hypothetical protein
LDQENVFVNILRALILWYYKSLKEKEKEKEKKKRRGEKRREE